MADNSISILIQAKDQASAVIKGVSGQLEESTGRMSGSIKAGAAAAGTALAGLSVAAAAAGAAALAAGTVIGFKFNSSVEQATATINAFTKDGAKTAQILADIKAESVKTQFSFVEMAEATASLIPASRASGVALNDLVKEAEILAALNPAEGLVGAAFSLKEALSGDFVSIVERFNLPRQRLNELKEQGVPAIQAVQTALREMGIDYDLVTKQGETTAARWNTMKDQFTQMAGAMTEPIFDRVSEQLSRMSGSIDWEAWGVRGAAAIEQVFYWGGQLAIGAQQLGSILWTYLGPSLTQLWNMITSQLVPALQEMFRLIGPSTIEQMKVLAVIIGGAVVVALQLLVGTLTNVIRVVSEVIRVANYISGPFIAASDAIRNAFVGTFRTIASVYNNTIGKLKLDIPSWVPGLGGKKYSLPTIPSFATGTSYAPGGLALVGERGPELVNLPRGSQVRTAAETRSMAGQAPQVTNNIYGNIQLNDAGAVDRFFERLDRSGQLTSMGLAA